MGFDDFFKHGRHGHHNNHYYDGHRHGHHGGIEQYLYLYEKLKDNPKLLKILVFAAVIIAIVVLALIVMLMPLIIKLLGTIQKSGISGLIESAKPLLQLIWSGSGK